jgi:hypothetical protein
VTALPPYAEKILSDWLRAHVELAEIDGVRVVGKTPEDDATPWVRLTQLDAQSQGSPHRLVEFYVQLDCYAGVEGGQPEANRLAQAVFAALADLDGANHQAEGAVVTASRPNMGLRRPDDDGFNPARERFVSTAFVHMHPTGEQGGS